MKTLPLQEQISSGYCNVDCEVEAILNQTSPVLARAADAQFVSQKIAMQYRDLPLPGRNAPALSTPAGYFTSRF